MSDEASQIAVGSLTDPIRKLARKAAIFIEELTDAGVAPYMASELGKQYLYLLMNMITLEQKDVSTED